jgi:hypothetical protein
MALETYFKKLDISIEILTNELTVFYNEYDTIQHVVQGLIKEGCLGQRYKSYSGTILTDKTYELTVKMNNGYVIYEYRKHFSGFLQADASGGGSGPSNINPPINLTTASAVDVAQGWLKVNGTDLSQCTNAIAITLGEGNKMYNVPGIWAPGSGITDKNAFPNPETEPGGPWQLTGLNNSAWGPYTSKELGGCSDDPDWITCQAKWAKRYVESDLYPEDIYNDYYGCVNGLRPLTTSCIAGDPTRGGKNCTMNPLPDCCVGHHWELPITKIYDNSLGQPWCGCAHSSTGGETIGFSGRCMTGHPENYYTAWLPIAKNVCQAAMQ